MQAPLPALCLSLFRVVGTEEELALMEICRYLRLSIKKKTHILTTLPLLTFHNVCREFGESLAFLLSFSLYLKKLYSNTGEHELEQRGDDDDVADGPDGHKHTLHNMLENTPEMIVSFCVCLFC